MVKNRPLMVLALVISGIFVGALAYFFSASETGFAILTILISITLIVILGRYIWREARKAGIFDIAVLFSLFFLAYNTALPIEVSLRYLSSHDVELGYPLDFGIEQFALTAFLSLLAGAMFVVGAKLASRISFNPGIPAVRLDDNLSLLAGTILFAFGLLLFFLDYSRIGGYLNALTMDRVVRLNLLSELRGNLPYSPFILVGLAFMAYASLISRRSRLRVTMTITGSLFFMSLLMIGGDRRFSLYILLVLFSVYSTLKGPIRLSRRILWAGLCMYGLFAIFQSVRWMFPLIVAGDLSFQTALPLLAHKLSYTLLLPSSTEFAGPYLSLLYYTTTVPSPMGGTSYLYALPYLLPRSLYPGTKVPTISQDFALQIHQAFYYQRPGIVGWGFNPVAESIANFGYAGPVIVFVSLGFIFTLATRLKNRGAIGRLVLAVMSPVAFNLNRADFANAFQEIAYNVVFVIAVAIVIWIMQNAFVINIALHNRRNHKHLKPFRGATPAGNLGEIK